MIKLFILLAILFLLASFMWQLRNYLTRDKKIEELEGVLLKGDLMDIDKEIAEEKMRQQDLSSEIDDINSQNQSNKEDIK